MQAGSMQAGLLKTRDIPSPVLTGQVQRVWISAGSMRGTPCQSPSLVATLNEVAGTARTRRIATPGPDRTRGLMKLWC